MICPIFRWFREKLNGKTYEPITLHLYMGHIGKFSAGVLTTHVSTSITRIRACTCVLASTGKHKLRVWIQLHPTCSMAVSRGGTCSGRMFVLNAVTSRCALVPWLNHWRLSEWVTVHWSPRGSLPLAAYLQMLMGVVWGWITTVLTCKAAHGESRQVACKVEHNLSWQPMAGHCQLENTS